MTLNQPPARGQVRGQKGKDKMSIKLIGIEISEDGKTAWRKNGGSIERRCLYNESTRWESVALTEDCPRTAAELEACCDAGGFEYRPRAVARIFQEPTGLYHICDDEEDFLDARGRGYHSKIAAVRAAARSYTHATGSGCPWQGVRSLESYLI